MIIGNKIKSIENMTMKHGDKRKVCVWWKAEHWCHGIAVGFTEGMLHSHRALSPWFPSCCWLLACLKFHSPGIIFRSLLFINAGILAMMSLTLFKTLQRLLGQKPLCLPQPWGSVGLLQCKRGPVKCTQLIRASSSLKCSALSTLYYPTLPTLPVAGLKRPCNLRGLPQPEIAGLNFRVSECLQHLPVSAGGVDGSFPIQVPNHVTELRRVARPPSFSTSLPASPSKQIVPEHASCTNYKDPSHELSVKCLGDLRWHGVMLCDTVYTHPC